MRFGIGIQFCRPVLSAVLCLGVTGFAVYSMATAKTFFTAEGNPAVLESADDPVRNGFRIVEVPHTSLPRLAENESDPAVILLDQWTFTAKTNPSNYQ